MHSFLFEVQGVTAHTCGFVCLVTFLAAIAVTVALAMRGGVSLWNMVAIAFMITIASEEMARLRFVMVERTSHTRRKLKGGLWAIAAVGPLLFGCSVSETHTVDTALLLPQNLGDWVKEPDPVIYDRKTICDYINGAGEVYRSYAFDNVIVARYGNSEGLAVTVELFDMGNSADAFGVYSYAREQEETGIGTAFERGGSILCFWQDRFYVCVAAEQLDPDPAAIIEEVARGVSQGLPEAGTRPSMVDMLPTEGLRPLSERFFHLHQTLNYHFYLVKENVLNLSPQTNAILGRYGSGSTILLIIDYGDEGEASESLVSFRQFVARNRVSAETHKPQEGETDRQTLGTEKWKYISSAQQGRFLLVALNGEDATAVEALTKAASRNILVAGN
ncbi:MAG: hypothetical protein JSV91_13125 [Phycisphaerales bacterium]|nr:MAG: hypothetical protein JSV91_13125 [Phycisphaerales bacterium]